MAGKKGGKKGGSTAATVISTIILVAAVGVFAFAAFKLLGYYMEYKKGTDEYSSLSSQYMNAQTPDTSGNTSGNTAGTPISAVPSGTQPQTEISASGVVTRDGIVLDNYKNLQNPATVESEKEKSKTEETVENGQAKALPVLANPVNFTELQGINSDIIGWISIDALNISYPIAQAADNDYYLHRTFRREDNFAGCIFLNCDNSRYFTDQNSIIYGHNMKNGSMFGILSRFQDQSVYDSNPYFWIFTPQLIYQYRIFACSTVSRAGDPYRTRFMTDEFQNFIDNSMAGSYINSHGVKPTTADRLVTLSTCTGDDSTRFIVQGMLEQIYISK